MCKIKFGKLIKFFRLNLNVKFFLNNLFYVLFTFDVYKKVFFHRFFQINMANRRHIGHNRSFSGNSMSVNPWQGGVPPTVSGISQLTDTQAQLALALTNLLRPPSLQQNQPLPSLLNLPQINPTSSYGDYHRHNYDYDDRDRYMNRSNNIRRGRFNDKVLFIFNIHPIIGFKIWSFLMNNSIIFFV